MKKILIFTAVMICSLAIAAPTVFAGISEKKTYSIDDEFEPIWRLLKTGEKELFSVKFMVKEWSKPTSDEEKEKAAKDNLKKKINEAAEAGKDERDIELAIEKKINGTQTSSINTEVLKFGPFTCDELKKLAGQLITNRYTLNVSEFSKPFKSEDGKYDIQQTLNPLAISPFWEFKSKMPKFDALAINNKAKERILNIFETSRKKEAERFARNICVKPGKCRRHVVKKGDTLAKIAKLYYDDAGYWKALNMYNFGNQPGDTIRVGQVLWIPPLKKLLKQ